MYILELSTDNCPFILSNNSLHFKLEHLKGAKNSNNNNNSKPPALRIINNACKKFIGNFLGIFKL